MAVWPSTLPISRENFSESAPDRVIRSNMEVGPSKIRRRSTAAVRNVQLRLILSDAELDTFEAFYDENDALTFDFVNPRTSVTEKARFVEAPSFNLNETLWNVSVKLELLP